MQFIKLHLFDFNSDSTIKSAGLLIVNPLDISSIRSYTGYSYKYTPLEDSNETFEDSILNAAIDHPSIIVSNNKEYQVFESPSYIYDNMLTIES